MNKRKRLFSKINCNQLAMYSAVCFLTSLFLPAVKHEKTLMGYECCLFGFILTFTGKSEGGVGVDIGWISMVGTTANVFMFVSWLIILGAISSMSGVRNTVVAILASCVLFLVLVPNRAIESAYIGYWLWIVAIALAGLSVLSKRTQKAAISD